ncbi:hypothetical protein [Rhodohalobacter sp. 614A]|uniref:hypothetical protein n=1 Tax=Rhodohalobacter sp. 614A TaxID=2908649 RepID=UPI001F2DBA95|nr:hypothetical protein [Rhodohalobacter sp. 614A]
MCAFLCIVAMRVPEYELRRYPQTCPGTAKRDDFSEKHRSEELNKVEPGDGV